MGLLIYLQYGWPLGACGLVMPFPTTIGTIYFDSILFGLPRCGSLALLTYFRPPFELASSFLLCLEE